MKPEIELFKYHKPRLIGEEQFFKAAVCISLLPQTAGYDILFEVRSNDIPDQPGDICLPGGSLEEGESYEQAAIRETCEELLIQPEQLTILGPSDVMHSGNTLICPYVGIVHNYQGTFRKAEVAEVFRVPLSFFLETEPAKYEIDGIVQPGKDFPYELINGGKNYKWRSRKTVELFYQYDNHVIWGLTARIIRSFSEIIKNKYPPA